MTAVENTLTLGTANTPNATRIMLLGSGELGKEFAIEALRLGLEVIAVDRYPNAPAMHVAQHAEVIDMLDAAALRAVIEKYNPNWVVPEIEAIATAELQKLEQEGVTVVPSALAAQLTMDREGIRRLAAEELGLATSPYAFADTFEAYQAAIETVGLPCVVKPVMSSSGKGQSIVKQPADIKTAWQHAQDGGRAGAGRVIVEGFIDFDYEITLLTVRHADVIDYLDPNAQPTTKTSFCEPIGHSQVDGDYRESWQPQAMLPDALEKAQSIAATVTDALGGHGLFGVELFVKGDEVWFSEVSPRPHDTGMVTLISQNLSEFALHLRAILGLPIPRIRQYGPAASAVILAEGESEQLAYSRLDAALAEPDTDVRLFGKPTITGRRRLGVGLALGEDIADAHHKACAVADAVNVNHLDV